MQMKLTLTNESSHIQTLAAGHVVPEADRCIQCGICSFNCPIGIDVRMHAWLGEYVEDSYCLTCGECVERCPRGVLHFEKTSLYMEGEG
jgi:NAD-dependent dihydropyrimidine dehydrogenase PreA subunit